MTYNPHELLKSSDIRLTRRAFRQRWQKTTIMQGCRVSVSFAKEEYKAFTADIGFNVSWHIEHNVPLEWTGPDRTITLTPPVDKD